MFGLKKRRSTPAAQTVPRVGNAMEQAFFSGKTLTRAERELYRSLRESVPVIDAALGKIVRLIGSFQIVAEDSEAQRVADDFMRGVRVNGVDSGLMPFVWSFLDSLLTYGEAVGELIPSPDGRGVAALYNASLDVAEIVEGDSPLQLLVCRREGAKSVPVPYQELVTPGLLNQKPGTARGTSVLSGLPFVSSILMRIFEAVRNNWERVGDVRFAVTYKPENGAAFSEESARQIASEWKKAMRSDTVCDFVSVGDVSVRVIGADNIMPDCEAPVRAVLEQLLSKLGIPPFLLGLSWSSTERMSEQPADILTSELEYYRAAVEPAVRRAVGTHLRLMGFNCGFDIAWNDINLQDAVELSQARLNNARAARLEQEIGREAEA